MIIMSAPLPDRQGTLLLRWIVHMHHAVTQLQQSVLQPAFNRTAADVNMLQSSNKAHSYHRGWLLSTVATHTPACNQSAVLDSPACRSPGHAIMLLS